MLKTINNKKLLHFKKEKKKMRKILSIKKFILVIGLMMFSLVSASPIVFAKPVQKEALTVKLPTLGLSRKEDHLLRPGDKIEYLRDDKQNDDFVVIRHNSLEYLIPREMMVKYFSAEDMKKFFEKENNLKFLKKDKNISNYINVISLSSIDRDKNLLNGLTKDFYTKETSDEGKFKDVLAYVQAKNFRYGEGKNGEDQLETIKSGYTMCYGISRLQACLYDKCGLEYRFVWASAYNPKTNSLANDRFNHIYLETKLGGKWYRTDFVGLLSSNDYASKNDIEFYKNMPGLTENDPVVPLGNIDVDKRYPSYYYQVSPSVLNGKYVNNKIISCFYRNANVDDFLRSLSK